MRTLLWSYLGWRRFPRDMSAFEVRHFFSFSVADRRELRVRHPRRLRLGAALRRTSAVYVRKLHAARAN